MGSEQHANMGKQVFPVKSKNKKRVHIQPLDKLPKYRNVAFKVETHLVLVEFTPQIQEKEAKHHCSWQKGMWECNMVQVHLFSARKIATALMVQEHMGQTETSFINQLPHCEKLCPIKTALQSTDQFLKKVGLTSLNQASGGL